MYPFPTICPKPRLESSRNKPIARQQELFVDICQIVKPISILEVGSWLGSSAIAWAVASSKFQPTAVVYCVDTWLGSVEHFLSSQGEAWNIDKLSLTNYGPTFFDDFLANIWDSDLQDKILPFRADSSSALPFLERQGAFFDVIYIDGAHDYNSVRRDVSNALPLVSSQGIICGDDFSWDSVRDGLRSVVLSKSTPLFVYSKGSDFALISRSNPGYAQALLQAGYKRWRPIDPVRFICHIAYSLKRKIVKLIS